MSGPESFDHVVVGAGSAGATLAARLSEDRATRVLLLEAGPPAAGAATRVPAAWANLLSSEWDWRQRTVPQPGLGGRVDPWPRMRATGGCSSMNGMVYVRGNRADYDGWQRDHGAVGWSYRDLLPLFVRSEANSRLGAPFHGRSGPLHVEDRRYTHEVVDAWIAAARAAGMPANDDFNGADQLGVGRYQVTCRHGRRWSTADAYLTPARRRPNLVVRTGALVTRVLLERGRATGVAYLSGGAQHAVRAEREVVLCGGAVNSPQLLMLSGIGPADHLREVGITPVVDLPGVGANLHNHPSTPVVWRTRGTPDLLVDHAGTRELLRWRLTGGGPLTSNGPEGGGFLETRSGLEGPDVQFHVVPTGAYGHALRAPEVRMLTVAVTLVDVASRGTLRLAGADPRWRPLLDPAYFRERSDLAAVEAGVRRAIEVAHERPLARFVAGPHLHGSDTLDDAALHEHVARWSHTLFHPVGTCAMGVSEAAVVDPQLRVRGVQGLRVADASVVPRIVRGNTNAPVIVIGERAADLLRGEGSPPTAPPALEPATGPATGPTTRPVGAAPRTGGGAR
ncbi:GMC family oxidoreductase [Kineococcus gypseus]|uniref:GMC family oxidoreductase n=1 Tax=Kineococcus gypseus TaxID=1637102 RepID=UPI003D7D8ABB